MLQVKLFLPLKLYIYRDGLFFCLALIIQSSTKKEHTNADVQSRSPAESEYEEKPEIYKIYYCEDYPGYPEQVQILLLQLESILFCDLLSNLCKMVGLLKYTVTISNHFLTTKLSYQFITIVYWGCMRVIIPEKYRNQLLELIHDTHPGMTKVKAVALSHIWYGLIWIFRLKKWYANDLHVNRIFVHLLQHHYNLGLGQNLPGREFTLTLL